MRSNVIEYLIWKLSHVVLNIEVVKGEPAFLGGKKSFWKVLILLHKQVKRRFHLTVFVFLSIFPYYKKNYLNWVMNNFFWIPTLRVSKSIPCGKVKVRMWRKIPLGHCSIKIHHYRPGKSYFQSCIDTVKIFHFSITFLARKKTL